MTKVVYLGLELKRLDVAGSGKVRRLNALAEMYPHTICMAQLRTRFHSPRGCVAAILTSPSLILYSSSWCCRFATIYAHPFPVLGSITLGPDGGEPGALARKRLGNLSPTPGTKPHELFVDQQRQLIACQRANIPISTRFSRERMRQRDRLVSGYTIGRLIGRVQQFG
jgi:hypothetical protein